MTYPMIKSDFVAKTVLFLIYLSLAVLALSGGGLFPWPVFFCAIIFSSLALLLTSRSSSESSLPHIVSIILLAGLLLSLLPLPNWLEPSAYSLRVQQNETVRSALVEASELKLTSHTPSVFSFTRNRPGTIRFILLLSIALSAGVCVSSFSNERRLALVKGLIVFNLLLALAGMAGKYFFPQGKTLLWFLKTAHGEPMGSFINRNHFGGFTALGAVAAFAITAWQIKEKQPLSSLLWGLSFFLLSFCTIASLSRGATIAMATGIGTVLLFSFKQKIFTGLLPLILLVSLFLFPLVLRPDHPVVKRAFSINPSGLKQSFNLRSNTWKDGLRITADYPIFGSGANSFRSLIPSYRTTSERKQFRHAENEYIQAVADLGLSGLLCIAVICVCTIGTLVREEKNVSSKSLLALISTGILATIMIHAVVDFALHLPLYLIFTVILISAGVPDKIPRIKLHAKLQNMVAFLPFISILMSAPLLNDAYNLDSPDYIQNAAPDTIARSLVACPTEWNSWYNLGRAASQNTSQRSALFAEKCISTAVKYNPLDYRLMLELARFHYHNKNYNSASEAYTKVKELRSWINDPDLERLKTR